MADLHDQDRPRPRWPERPERWPRSPHGCPHRRGDKYAGDELMNGKGNVIGHHIRCTGCGIIIETAWSKGPER